MSLSIICVSQHSSEESLFLPEGLSDFSITAITWWVFTQNVLKVQVIVVKGSLLLLEHHSEFTKTRLICRGYELLSACLTLILIRLCSTAKHFTITGKV